MAKDDYLPRSMAGRLAWFINFDTKISTYTTTFQLPTGAITGAHADFLMFQYAFSLQEIVQTYSQNVTGFLNQVSNGPNQGSALPLPAMPTPPTAPATVVTGIFTRVRDLVRRIKAHPNYTVNIGEDLGIEGSSQTASLVTGPSFKAVAKINWVVELQWKKKGSSGVQVECMRGSEAGWTVIGQDFRSPFTDNRAPLVANQPETRRYRMSYLVNDVTTGPVSDTVTIVASG